MNKTMASFLLNVIMVVSVIMVDTMLMPRLL